MSGCNMGKLSLYARKRIVNLRRLGKNVSEIVRKIREEDNITASRPAVSLFLKRFNQTGSINDKQRTGRHRKLVLQHFDIIDEEMRRNDELSSIELARILRTRCDVDVSPRTVRQVRKKLGWTWSGTKYCQLVKDVNKPKRMEHCLRILSEGDGFEDVTFSDECSVSIERSTRRSFHKVGEPRRLKGKPKHPLKVSFCPLLLSSTFFGNILSPRLKFRFQSNSSISSKGFPSLFGYLIDACVDRIDFAWGSKLVYCRVETTLGEKRNGIISC